MLIMQVMHNLSANGIHGVPCSTWPFVNLNILEKDSTYSHSLSLNFAVINFVHVIKKEKKRS